MVKFRRRRNFSKKVNTTKARFKTGARSQSTQIIKLQKQVNRLDIKTKDLILHARFSINDVFSMTAGGVLNPTLPANQNSGLYVRELFIPAQLQPIFNTTANFDENVKVRLSSCVVNGSIGIIPNGIGVTQVAPRYIQVWIVSLKKETGKQLLTDTNGMAQASFRLQANGSAFTKSPILTIPVLNNTISKNGNYFLNPNLFNIRKYKTFTIGNTPNSNVTSPGTESTGYNMKDLSRNFSFKFRMNNYIRTATGGSTWKQLTPQELQNQDRLWMIVTCNGWDNNQPDTPQPDPNDQLVQMNTQTLFKIHGSQ